MKLSIIIPAYDEENRIGKTLSAYYSFFLKLFNNNFEIIVIASNCSDKTPEIIKNFVKNKKQMKYKIIPGKTGKGGAIIEGFRIATGDLIGFADADNATDPAAFNNLIQKIGDYDGAIASRWVKGAKILTPQSFTRRVASRILNIMVRLLFQMNFNDTQCGAKLFKKEPLKNILPEIKSEDWTFDIDLLYNMQKRGSKIKEMPITWNERGGSKLNIKKTSLEMLFSITRLRLIHSPLKFIFK